MAGPTLRGGASPETEMRVLFVAPYVPSRVRIRPYELVRALARLGTTDPKTAEVVDDLTRVLSRKILTDTTFSVRASAEDGDLAAAESLVKAVTRGDRISIDPSNKRL